MRLLKSNPQALLLVNPGKRRVVKKSKSKVKSKSKPAVKARTTSAKSAKSAKSKTVKPKVAKRAEAKLPRWLANPKLIEKRISAAATKAAKSQQEQLRKLREEMKQMRKAKRIGGKSRKGVRNPKASPEATAKEMAARKRIKKVSALEEQIARLQAQSKAEAKKAKEAKTAVAKATAEKKAAKTAEKAAKQAAKLERQSAKFAVVAAKLGLSPADALGQFGTVKAARSWLTAKTKAERAMKRKIREAKKTGRAARLVESKAARERKAVRAAERAAKALPRGTSIKSLPGYPPTPPPAPGPLRPRGSKAQLVLPHPWRPPILGKADPGWYQHFTRSGGYKYVANPKKGKKGKKGAKKVGAITRTMRKIPLIGGLFKNPRRKTRSWKRNPEFSLGEIVKITLAGGAGYFGGNVVSGFGTTAAAAIGLHGMFGGLAGSAAAIVLTHVLLKNSAYYVPVMAGVGVGAVSRAFASMGEGNGKDEGAPAPSLLGKVGSFFGGKGMGDSSDDELLASIDASLDEYVDVPMNEYVDVPMNEYVDVPMDGYEELAEYVDVPMGAYSWESPANLGAEYIDVGVEGYEELADAEAEAAYALADEYSAQIPGLDYGEMTDEEVSGFEELADEDNGYDVEELADQYEALADDYEEAEDLGAISAPAPRQLRAIRNKARSLRGRGGRVSPTTMRAVQAARANVRIRITEAAAGKLRADVQKAVLAAAENTKAAPGSRAHFQYTFKVFSAGFGAGATHPDVRKAFLVAYRAATKGQAAAAQAAVNAGVPAAVASAVAAPPAPTAVDSVGRGAAGPVEALPGGGFARAIPVQQPRFRRVRRAGEGAPQFGGIFARSIFGVRGRAGR